MRWLDNITDLLDVSLSKVQEIIKDGEPVVLESMEWQRVRHDLMIEQQYTQSGVEQVKWLPNPLNDLFFKKALVHSVFLFQFKHYNKY